MRALTAALAAALLAGCGGGFSCSSPGTCKADAAPSGAEIAVCQKALDDAACGTQARTYYTCLHDQLQCDAQGHRDDLATVGHCTRELADLESCCSANASSVSCQAS